MLWVIIAIRNSDDPSAHLSKLEKLRDKVDKSDVIMDGTLNRLIRDNHITNEMATSLMNDSAAVTNIVKNLIAVAELLYIKKDPIFQESKTPELLELEEGILSDENGQM